MKKSNLFKWSSNICNVYIYRISCFWSHVASFCACKQIPHIMSCSHWSLQPGFHWELDRLEIVAVTFHWFTQRALKVVYALEIFTKWLGLRSSRNKQRQSSNISTAVRCQRFCADAKSCSCDANLALHFISQLSHAVRSVPYPQPTPQIPHLLLFDITL